MHELSIALDIVHAVSERAAELAIAKIDAVRIRVGELSGVDKTALQFAWELAAEGSAAAGSELRFEDVPLKVKCSSCGAERNPPEKWQLACPECPQARPMILAGREFHIVALEVPE